MKKYMSQDEVIDEDANPGEVRKVKKGKILLNQNSNDGNLETMNVMNARKASAGHISPSKD